FSVTAKGIAFNAQSVLERPFYNDCTYNIDFEYCKWKTKLINPQTNVYYEPQGQFLKNIVEEDKSNKLQPTNLTTSSNEHYQVLIITK
ncbi:MAG TPA: hypothetical protein VLF89_09520, partial [Candidatus Saccharimonadales bacterium]|nr:hypothetical protein [Candidatus Saccharimonadales bacterium]